MSIILLDLPGADSGQSSLMRNFSRNASCNGDNIVPVTFRSFPRRAVTMILIVLMHTISMNDHTLAGDGDSDEECAPAPMFDPLELAETADRRVANELSKDLTPNESLTLMRMLSEIDTKLHENVDGNPRARYANIQLEAKIGFYNMLVSRFADASKRGCTLPSWRTLVAAVQNGQINRRVKNEVRNQLRLWIGAVAFNQRDHIAADEAQAHADIMTTWLHAARREGASSHVSANDLSDLGKRIKFYRGRNVSIPGNWTAEQIQPMGRDRIGHEFTDSVLISLQTKRARETHKIELVAEEIPAGLEIGKTVNTTVTGRVFSAGMTNVPVLVGKLKMAPSTKRISF